jgi:hypothetical protein
MNDEKIGSIVRKMHCVEQGGGAMCMEPNCKKSALEIMSEENQELVEIIKLFY